MSLEVILESIAAGGEAEAARLRAETDARVQQVLAEAERAAADRREDRRRAALFPAAGDRARRLHQARLESLRAVGEARDQLIEAVLAETRRRLEEVRTDPNYPDILRRLTEEVASVMAHEYAAGNAPRLEVDPRDEALLRSILAALGLEASISANLSCWGGVVARSANSRIVAINTLETRLERATPFLRRDLAAYFDRAQTETDAALWATSTTATPA
jgi:vacuolar-type H+-ATPase subunit E/Vma4